MTDAQSCDWPEVYQVILACYLDEKTELTERQERHVYRAMTEGSVPGRRWINAELVAMLMPLDPSKRDVQLRKIPPDLSLKAFSALKHVFNNWIPLFGYVSKSEKPCTMRSITRTKGSTLCSSMEYPHTIRKMIALTSLYEDVHVSHDDKARINPQGPRIDSTSARLTF